jgi:hypothetical protein
MSRASLCRVVIADGTADVQVVGAIALVDLCLCLEQPAKHGLALLGMGAARHVDLFGTKTLNGF